MGRGNVPPRHWAQWRCPSSPLLSVSLPFQIGEDAGSQHGGGDDTRKGGAVFHIWLVCPWKRMVGESLCPWHAISGDLGQWLVGSPTYSTCAQIQLAAFSRNSNTSISAVPVLRYFYSCSGKFFRELSPWSSCLFASLAAGVQKLSTCSNLVATNSPLQLERNCE